MTSASSPPPAPASASNLLTIFQAHFHVRRGNELTYRHGHRGVNLDGVEWKVLPSGSHALESDLIWFQPEGETGAGEDGGEEAEGEGGPLASTSIYDAPESDERGSETLGRHKIGVAMFRNTKLPRGDNQGAAGSSSSSNGGSNAASSSQSALDQRGARMIAVGFVAACHDSSPSARLAACLPHLDALSRLADQSALDPTNHALLSHFLDQRRLDTSSLASTAATLATLEAERCPFSLSRRPRSSFDPILDLPSVANALGLILPDLLRTLLVRGTRLLIHSPMGAETKSAASIAWILSEIIEAALNEGDGDGGEEDKYRDEKDEEAVDDAEVGAGAADTAADTAAPASPRRRRGPLVRGIIGLQDMMQLTEEEAQRQRRQQQQASQSGQSSPSPSSPGWIAWTADKLYLDKPDLYDCLLDLGPLFSAAAPTTAPATHHSPTGASSLLASCDSASPGTSPRFSRVERIPDKTGRKAFVARLKPQSWHPRDFAVYRANELRSVKLASRPRSLARRSSRSSMRFSSDDGGGGDRCLANTKFNKMQLQQTPKLGRVASSASIKPVSPVALLSTLIGFVRFWLSSLWFIPKQWRINLRESYGYVPLSIRPDGGVQAGLMLLPDSDSESEADDPDGDDDSSDDEGGDDAAGQGKGRASASGSPKTPPSTSVKGSPKTPAAAASRSGTANSAASSQYLQVPSPHSRASTAEGTAADAVKSCEHGGGAGEEDDEDDADYGADVSGYSVGSEPGHSDIDPLLAACGASPSSSRRLSRSSRQAITAAKATKDVMVGTDRRSSHDSDDEDDEDVEEYSEEEAGAQASTPRPNRHGHGQAHRSAPRASPSKSSTPPSSTADREDARSVGRLTSSSHGTATATTTTSRSGDSRQLKAQSQSHSQRRRSKSTRGTSAGTSPRDSRLARAIFAIWAEWLSELVLALEELALPHSVLGAQAQARTQTQMSASLSSHSSSSSTASSQGTARAKRVRAAALGEWREGEAEAEGETERTPLLPGDADTYADAGEKPPSWATQPALAPRDLSALGLNSRNEQDRLLVRALTGREVQVGYWKFWGNWF